MVTVVAAYDAVVGTSTHTGHNVKKRFAPLVHALALQWPERHTTLVALGHYDEIVARYCEASAQRDQALSDATNNRAVLRRHKRKPAVFDLADDD